MAVTAMPEARMLGEIRHLCDQFGLMFYHARDSRSSGDPGLPDLVIAGPRGLIFRELKPQEGDLRWHQRRWFRVLRQARQSCEIWRPSDWFSGQVRRELEIIAAVDSTQLALA